MTRRATKIVATLGPASSDPAMLEQLRNAPGFVPVIINIQPMTDLRMFLGLADNQSKPQIGVE